jgi:hypothetical protein
MDQMTAATEKPMDSQPPPDKPVDYTMLDCCADEAKAMSRQPTIIGAINNPKRERAVRA